MEIDNTMDFDERTKSYMPYYLITIGVAIAVGYFMILGGKVLRAIFILVIEYWWVSVIIILLIVLLKMRRKK